ncbi:MAG: nuclear transport factor 2 family protein [Deltaproteobacteria bacterium]|nr:nuclear transport factor 2 family protein [Deltaproteobacteria bacterium]
MSESEQNKQITRALFAALSRADAAAVAEMYADDFTLWTAGTLPFSGTFNKTQALQGMDQILGLFPDGLQFTITAMTAEGERVAVEAESDGRHASGKRYHNQYHFLVIVRDGKIVQLKEYMDTMHAQAVLLGG